MSHPSAPTIRPHSNSYAITNLHHWPVFNLTQKITPHNCIQVWAFRSRSLRYFTVDLHTAIPWHLIFSSSFTHSYLTLMCQQCSKAAGSGMRGIYHCACLKCFWLVDSSFAVLLISWVCSCSHCYRGWPYIKACLARSAEFSCSLNPNRQIGFSTSCFWVNGAAEDCELSYLMQKKIVASI